MTVKRTTILGVYLLAAGLLQVWFYFVMTMATDEESWLYFDPRIGIFFLESITRGKEQITPDVFRWLSAAWISLLGVVLVWGRPIVKTYIVSELILMIPNVLFFLVIILGNLSPAHGFSIAELFFPSLIMLVFSIIPLGLSFWTRSKKEPQLNSLNLSRV